MTYRAGGLAIVVIAFGCLALRPLAADEEKQQGIPTATSEVEQVRQWVRQLDSDSFVDRERATDRLIDAGDVVVGPLVEALSESSLELATRGIHVLRELALSDDPQTAGSAREALVRVAAVRGTPIARRAGLTLDMLDEIRQDRAIDHLRRLGAKFGTTDLQFFNPAVFPEHRRVEIGDAWSGEAEDLQQLKWIGKMTQVTLNGEQINDDYVQQVSLLENLRYLSVKRAAISDEAMAHLKRLKNVEQIDVKYSPITDKSVEHLRFHGRASLLKLYGTQISKTAAAELQAVLKDTKVDHRHGAFLGVSGQPNQQGCEISFVQQGSAAEKAGLQQGDVIVQYDGQDVQGFEQLTDLIARNWAGDTVTMQVRRGSETLAKKITLGEWD